MQVHIVSIGNELLIGDIINTNAAWLGKVLNDEGMHISRIHTVGDNLRRVKQTIAFALDAADLVVVTGGLGPTHDDVTKQALAELFDCNLVRNEQVLSFIQEIFKKRGLPFTESNYRQAEVPDCCEILFNKQGTAPGMWFQRERATLIVLPGVPHEMEHLVNELVLPKLHRLSSRQRPETRYLLTSGIGESTLSDRVLSELENLLDSQTDVAFLPGVRGVTLRITGRGDTPETVRQRVDRVAEYIKKETGAYFVGEGGNLELAEVVGELLGEYNASLATAESCTGGFIANEITNVSGCSHYLKGGVVAYSNEVKVNQLDVDPEVIKANGAVSKEVALQMAKGAAKRLNADIGVSTTGIAGPTGGTEEKPVGTVWMGFWTKNQHFSLQAQFTNDRLINKERTSAVALNTLRMMLLGSEETPYGLQKHTA